MINPNDVLYFPKDDKVFICLTDSKGFSEGINDVILEDGVQGFSIKKSILHLFLLKGTVENLGQM